MLNTFPHLLVLGFFAPTLLRVAVACALFYCAYHVYTHRAAPGHANFPVVGRAPWASGFAMIAYGIFGLMLFFGYYTQIAAILTALSSIKGLVFRERYTSLFPFSASTYALILVISVSLIFSGAGAFAYDLPL